MPIDEPQAFPPAQSSPASPAGGRPVGGAPGGDVARVRADPPVGEPTGDSAGVAPEAVADEVESRPGAEADWGPGATRAGVPPADSPVAARIRQVVADLDDIDNVPLVDHAERYSAAHTALQATLSEIDNPAGG